MLTLLIPIPMMILFLLHFPSFGSNNTEYSSKTTVKQNTSKMNKNGKKEMLSAKEHERSTVWQQLHDKKVCSFFFSIIESQLKLSLHEHRGEGKTTTAATAVIFTSPPGSPPSWLLPRPFRTTTSSQSQTHLVIFEPPSLWVIYTNLNPQSMTLCFLEFDEWKVLTPICSEKNVWTAARVYGRCCEDTNYDKWCRLGHLRCERARGNTEGLSLWVALNANGRILNSIQTLIPTGLRRSERLTAEANFIYQDQKASRHISEYIRLKKKKNFRRSITFDGGKKTGPRD